MRARRARTATLTAATLVATMLLAAQRVSAQPGPAQAPGVRLFEEAAQHFERREYDQAITKFLAAYPLYPEPLILLNVATAYRKQGACDDARTYYRRYLDTQPDADLRRKAEERLAEMEACVAARPAAAVDTTRVPDPTVPPAASIPAPPDAIAPVTTPASPSPDGSAVDPTSRPGRGKRIAGLITLGAGVVLAGTGVWFSLQARGAAADVEDACQGGCLADDVAGLDADGKAAQRNATIFYAASGAAVVAGAAVAVWGWREGRASSRHVALVPSRSGAIAVAAWSF